MKNIDSPPLAPSLVTIQPKKIINVVTIMFDTSVIVNLVNVFTDLPTQLGFSHLHHLTQKID